MSKLIKPMLGYWACRGRVESARLLLEYGGLKYDQTKYVQGDGPEFSRNAWFDVKYNQGMDFPNLPYYVEGDFKLTESTAIYRYIAQKVGLVLTDPKEQALADMVSPNIDIVRTKFSELCNTPGEKGLEVAKADFFEDYLPKHLDVYCKFLNGKKWLAGDNLSFVDFQFAEVLDTIQTMNPNCFDKHTTVKDYVDRFFKLENIQAYRASDRYQKFPLKNKSAKWGGDVPSS